MFWGDQLRQLVSMWILGWLSSLGVFFIKKHLNISWPKNKGCSLASRCHNCHQSEESDYHIFFSYNLANALRSWLLTPCGCSLSVLSSVIAIWDAIFLGGDAFRRQLAVAVFFHAISILWLLCNDSKNNGRKPTIEHAKVLFADRIRGLIISLNTVKGDIYHHPILMFFDMAI